MFVSQRPPGGFKYQALTPELLGMSEELASLGGGDTRVGKLSVHVRVCPTPHLASPIVTVAEDVVSVRDPRCGDDIPASQATRRYKVTEALPSHTRQDQLHSSLGKEALEWFLDGFNATIVTYGQSGTGKTHSLFGVGAGRSDGDLGLIPRMLADFFRRVGTDCKVGVSAWELLGNQTVDLLRPGDAGAWEGGAPLPGAPTDFTTVEVASLRDTHAILAHARRGSCCWASGPDGAAPDGAGGAVHTPSTPLPNRAHAFLRLVLVDGAAQRVSTLHVVDLVGSQSLSGHFEPKGTHLQQRERERRLAGQQLLAFSRVIAELSQRSTAASADPPGVASGRAAGAPGASKLVSARDSRLTQLLGPLLAGNSRTFLLVAASAAAADYLDTINTLRVAHRARSISTACMRTPGVSPADIPTVPLWKVLSWKHLQQTIPGRGAEAPAPRAEPTRRPDVARRAGNAARTLQESIERAEHDYGEEEGQDDATTGLLGVISEGGASSGGGSKLASKLIGGGVGGDGPIEVDDFLERMRGMGDAPAAGAGGGRAGWESPGGDDGTPDDGRHSSGGRLEAEVDAAYAGFKELLAGRGGAGDHISALEALASGGADGILGGGMDSARAHGRDWGLDPDDPPEGAGEGALGESFTMEDAEVTKINTPPLAARGAGAGHGEGREGARPPTDFSEHPPPRIDSDWLDMVGSAAAAGADIGHSMGGGGDAYLYGSAHGTFDSVDGGGEAYSHGATHGARTASGQAALGGSPAREPAPRGGGGGGEHGVYDSRALRELGMDSLKGELQRLKGEFRDIYQGMVDGEYPEDDFIAPATAGGYATAAAAAAAAVAPGLVSPPRAGGGPVAETVRARGVKEAAEAHRREEDAAKRIEELETSNESLLNMLKSERRKVEDARAKVRESEREMMELSTSYELRMEDASLGALQLRSRCRQLSSETLFAQVFDRYEREVESLQCEVRDLRADNATLYARALDAEEAAAVGAGGDLGDGREPERVLGLKKSLKSSHKECEDLRRELESLRKRERQYDVHRKGHEQITARLAQLQRALGEREEALQRASLEAARKGAAAHEARRDEAEARAAHERVSSENNALLGDVASLREQVQLLRQQNRRELIVSRLPVMPRGSSDLRESGSSKRAATSKPLAVELAYRLQREVDQTPKVAPLLNRLLAEIEKGVSERSTLQRREDLLIEMLTGESAPGGGGRGGGRGVAGGARPPPGAGGRAGPGAMSAGQRPMSAMSDRATSYAAGTATNAR